MKRITKKSLQENFRFTRDGKMFKLDIESLCNIKNHTFPNKKIRFHCWAGSKKHLTVSAIIDIALLAKLCNFEKGNDGRGGVDSDYIIITKSEYKKLSKRLSWFI